MRGINVRPAPLLVGIFILFGVFILSGCGGADAPATASRIVGAGVPFTLARTNFPMRRDRRAYSRPDGLAMDEKGTLYVATECNADDITYPASVEEFAYGSTSPMQTIGGHLCVGDFGASQVS